MQSEMLPICLGATQYDSALSEQECWRLLDRYFELGGHFINMAHFFSAHSIRLRI